MTFAELIQAYQNRFKPNGVFDLHLDESINFIVRKKNIPNERGIYLIHDSLGCSGQIIYIGKSGTINQDGTWKNQGIKVRLTKKQNGISRNVFFRNVIKTYALEGLSFKWFITFNESNQVLPSLAEAELLQTFFHEYSRLPILNMSF